MNSYILAAYLLSNVLMAYTVYRFMQIFFGRTAKNHIREALSYLAYIVGVSCVYLLWQQASLTLLANLSFIFIIAANYSDNLKEKSVATVFVGISFLICESLVAVAVAACDDVWLDRFSEAEMLFSQLCIPIVTLALIKSVSKLRILQGHEHIQLTAWLAVLAVPVCTTLPMLTIVVNGRSQSAPLIMVCLAELLMINVALFYLYDKLALLYQDQLETAMILQQQKAYQQQAELFQQKQEDMENLRHDLQHHIEALQSYCQQNHNDTALAYVERLSQTTQWPEQYVLTGLNALDAIVNYKLTQAQQSGIMVEKHIVVPDQLKVINDDDLCAVLGNLLDNALRAVAEMPEQQRLLSLKITYSKDVLTITVANPYQGALLKQRGRFLTTKTDSGQHGIGLRSVEKIVQKYHGNLTLNDDGQTFTADIWLSDHIWNNG